MTIEHERQIEELFQHAAGLPRGERAAFLDSNCADEQIRQRVERLLEHDDVAGNAFLRGGSAIGPNAAAAADVPQCPLQIGRYRILSVLGYGGMGTVYEAEQDRTQRKVALKVMRPGWMSRAMLRRFEYETVVLGRLEHRGIARIYDAGMADTGAAPQPYFAMELVQGQRLDLYVRHTDPPLKRRLELLCEICQAVHHAHTKGVIHRDLKPANIVITADGQPKILDFGVARATDSDIAATTLHTESGQIIGTLPYMAPEQAAGRAHELDTSSDVYALGVIAYELLSGAMPYSLEGKPLHEAVRVICEQEPTRLSSIDGSLRGDVETIVGKAMEKDRTRRYPTAGELASDVKRYLDYEPITARAPSAWYQLSRFAKRNKLMVAAVGVITLLLVGGVVTSTSFAIRAQREKIAALAQQKRADEESASATAVNDFLTIDVLGQASAAGQATPDRAPDRNLTVRQALDRAAERIPGRFTDQPRVEGSIRFSIGNAYRALGEFEQAEQHLRAALQLFRASGEIEGPNVFECMRSLGQLYLDSGRYEQSADMYRGAHELGSRHFGAEARETLVSVGELGLVYVMLGDLDRAEPLLQRAADGLGSDTSDPAASSINDSLASLYLRRQDYPNAERFFLRAIELSKKAHGEHHPSTLQSTGNLAWLYLEQHRYDVAEPIILRLVEDQQQTQGADHPDTLYCRHMLGMLYLGTKRPELALEVLSQSLESERKVLTDRHPLTLNTMNELGRVYEGQGKMDQAEELYRQAWNGKREVLGPRHTWTLYSLHNLARVLYGQRRYEEVEPLLRELVEAATEAKGAYAEELPRLRTMLASLNATTRPAPTATPN